MPVTSDVEVHAMNHSGRAKTRLDLGIFASNNESMIYG